MSDNFKKIVVAIAGALTSLVVAVILSFIAGQRYAQKSLILPQKERVDTLLIRDTITSEKPIYLTRTRVDSIPYPVTDTMWKTDTIWLEREQVVWQDSLSRVYASGVSVEIDSVSHFLTTTLVVEKRDVLVKVKPRWSIGVQAGYGAFAKNGQISSSPYIGVGVSYNLFSW